MLSFFTDKQITITSMFLLRKEIIFNDNHDGLLRIMMMMIILMAKVRNILFALVLGITSSIMVMLFVIITVMTLTTAMVHWLHLDWLWWQKVEKIQKLWYWWWQLQICWCYFGKIRWSTISKDLGFSSQKSNASFSPEK